MRKKINLISFDAFSLSVAPLVMLSSCSEFTEIEKDPRPNIIIIMADDMGYSDIGCYGGEIETPNIDRLGEQGIRFTQFHNASRSCPSRASLLTGLYPHQAGMGSMVRTNQGQTGPYQGYLSYESATIAEVLRDAGYSTLMSGKWHVGEGKPDWPTNRGFDRYFGLISGAANYFDITKVRSPNRERRMALDDEPFYPVQDSFYMTDAFTDYALQFVKEEQNNPAPFFLYLSYTAPHWPLHAWEEDIQKYEGNYMEGWDTIRQKRFEKQVAIGLFDSTHALPPRDPAIPDWNQLNPEKQKLMDRRMAVYAAQMDRMDQGIGKLLSLLEEMGELDNTLIFFLSDNGASAETGVFGHDWYGNDAWPGGVNSYQSYGLAWANVSNTPYRKYKARTFEGGILTPFIAFWPEEIKKTGGFDTTLLHIMDIIHTCCEAAEVSYPEQLSNRDITPSAGRSFLPLLFEGNVTPHETLFWEHENSHAIRKETWKLVKDRDREQWELYNLTKDPFESSNLFWQYYHDIASSMIKEYQEWADEVGVKNN